MFEKLPSRERQVFDVVCALGEATAVQIQSAISDAPSNSAIRIMLSRLEKKGFLTHRTERQTFVYSVVLSAPTLRRNALEHLVRTFFGGSSAGAAAALIGMSEEVDPSELDKLQQMIAQARARKSQ